MFHAFVKLYDRLGFAGVPVAKDGISLYHVPSLLSEIYLHASVNNLREDKT